MSPTPSATTVPPLTSVAELVHRQTSGVSVDQLVLVEHRRHDLSIGTKPIGAEAEHPADALVGFVAPAHSNAVGLATCGLEHDLDHPRRRPTPVRLTVIADRRGEIASVIERPKRDLQVLSDATLGWVADMLLRTMGLPTPPPTDRLARWIEVAWLDLIAVAALGRPGEIRSWPPIARAHPLHPDGPALPPALLGVEAEAFELGSSWTSLRQAMKTDWFDDGSFSRWVQRNQPPAEAILPAVLDALPDDVGRQLLDALVTL